jgi:hypothetical protein
MAPVVIFSFIIFCATAQVWMVLVALSGLVPPTNALSAVVWPEWQYVVRPERDALLFHCFVFLALMAQAAGIWSYRRKIIQPSFVRGVLPYFTAELLWTALMLCASFNIIVYDQRPWLAKGVFVALALGAMLSKIFWPEFKIWGEQFISKMLAWPFGVKANILAGAGLVLLLYVPDAKAVLARMFLGDQLHHFDTSYMAPAWAFTHGCVLNVDVMTEYGVGIPILMAWFARFMGGLDYTHAFMFLLWGTILYFVLCYVFLRLWLRSLGIAVAGTLLAIKFQMFHFGISPFVFTLPSATVIRYFWDIFFFLFLLGHLRSLRKRYLFAAAVCCGAQIFCMTTCGYCLTIAFMAYIASFLIVGELRKLVCKNILDYVGFISFIAVIPASLFFFLGLTQGHYLWTREFWFNMQEFNNYFLSGFGLMPMYETIQNKEVLAGFMGFFIPVVYLGTFLVTAGLVYWGKTQRDDLMAAILSLYGMAIYHYYIGRSAPTSYYVVCIPYVFILGFWINKWIANKAQQPRRSVLLCLLAAVLYALLTNHNYLAYPNMLNVSRNPIVDPMVVNPLPDGHSYFNQNVSKVTDADRVAVNSLGEKDEGIKFEKDFKTDADLKKYFDEEFDFSQDARLIASLTKPTEAVALLSGFEIRMLMQADRKQFFYYSPILVARPMRMRSFPISAMYTFDHAKRTLKQLEDARPEYLFMEKIFLEAQGFKNFKDASLVMVLNYIFEHYAPDKEGRYLVAMKRKEEAI